MDRACELWRGASGIHSGGYAIPYLLGVYAEMKGKLDEVLTCYKKADRMADEPVEEINQALTRIRGRIGEKERLERELER